uniref:uncharacterized protein LOC109961316 n=1 Tax=Monopterus albus TaxID=43700 RepID=UPI0009B33C79|nr:uncharacterized protein LOC109961316 [Monopterus albus]
MKVSIPQPPGRQSVEVYYPYDFAQQKIIKSIPPMTNAPHVLNTVFPFEYPFPHFPQQTLNNPAFDASPLPSQDPMQPLQQDEPKQPNQMPTKMTLWYINSFQVRDEADYPHSPSRDIFNCSLHQEKGRVMVKLLVFMMCLLATTLAAPAPDDENKEQVAAHANAALRWMEMYRLYQQQRLLRNPFLPVGNAPVRATPAQPDNVPRPAPVLVDDASEET